MGAIVIEGIFIGVLLLMFYLLRMELYRVEEIVNKLNTRVEDLELDDFMKRAFQTDNQRFDRLLRKYLDDIVDARLQEHKDKMKKMWEDWQ